MKLNTKLRAARGGDRGQGGGGEGQGSRAARVEARGGDRGQGGWRVGRVDVIEGGVEVIEGREGKGDRGQGGWR